MAPSSLTFLGFGEAAQAFANGLSGARAFDCRTDDPATREAKLADYARLRVEPCVGNAAAVAGAPLILSLVTADQALDAAEETARAIQPGTMFCDMNSVAPDTKRAAARAIETSGGRYVDVAVMAPVHPGHRAVPLLMSGPHAAAGKAALRAAGFTDVRALPGQLGTASAVKMIRSVMVKDIEALSAECTLAAHAAGVAEEVIASLDVSEKAQGWATRFDYDLDRMLVHGLLRAAEMEEVVKTLDALGTGAAARQRALGSIGAGSPDGLAKIDLANGRAEAA